MKYGALLLTGIMWLVVAAHARAASQDKYYVLAGLDNIELTVAAGDDVTAVKTAAELELRRVGIHVIELQRNTLTPYLFVAVENVCPENGGHCAVIVAASFQQRAILIRDPLIAGAFTTWQTVLYGTAGRLTYKEMAKEMTIKVVQSFANDYLAANPGQARAPGADKTKGQKSQPKMLPLHRQ
jgi:hypothetical protein